MKILHVINGLDTGGAEKLLIDLIPRLQNQGYQVDLLLLNGMRTPFHDKLLHLTNGNVFHLGSTYYNPLYVLKIVPYLKRYDLLHVHLFPAQYLVVLAKILSFSKVKLIFTEHNTSNRRLVNKKLRWIEKIIYRNYYKIICITAQVQKALIDNLAIQSDKLPIINNGIDLQTIRTAKIYDKQLFKFNYDDKILIMVAAFRIQKDQDTVIKALALLPLNYKLVLVGQGEREEELRKLVAELNLVDRVYFFGVRTDVYSLIKMADVAILSSHWEGFGLSAVEAMACGVPLIASDVDGLSQVVTGGGLLFEKGSVSELTRKIQSLEDPLVYEMVGSKGIEKAENYDISFMINKMVALYNVIFNGKSEKK